MADLEPVTEEMLEESNAPSAYISARHRRDAVEKSSGGGNYLLAGICAIIAAIVFVVLLWMLYGDYAALKIA